MLLSFSVPEMRPWIAAGLRQANGERLPDGTRVKRQTIRQRGPRGEMLLTQAVRWRHTGALHLWWKSRTKERANLGVVQGFQIYPLTISNYVSGTLKVDGPGESALEWTPEHGGARLQDFARSDGFESIDAFREYFVPNPGDRFNAVIFKW